MFYAERLGFEVLVDAPVEQIGGRWIEVRPGASATTIALEPAQEDAPAGGDTGIRLSTSDAPALHGDLRERGVDVGELLQWPGVPAMFALRDPDGNGLRVVEEPAD